MRVIYEDENLQVLDKPAGIDVDNIPRRVHRLDKDTSGILLVAKNDEVLEFFQRQFKERRIKKKYLCLVVGNLKNKEGEIKNLLGRSPKDRRKQKVFLPQEPGALGKREAITEYKVLERFKNYDLIEVEPQTGRKHQIRTHLAYLGHPVAGDKLYGFKGQTCPPGLKRQFLHASYLKIQLPNKKIKEFKSELPNDLKLCLQSLKPL
ncbi:hypothetical protein COT20_03015 [bacterium (Candidatus Gribaldobacteria) CG08_land_8_20_14_0_20_39_15]|uniref:Pseudouridine synthase RsuA/RluA-like domain-containing protein n=1 Tax=bacterium (Candidatus Gribaldobacteria) CG08_land_8_20_14_0_20_39_15 TaxID=2014273 RepID=A0A2M6XTQ8_9BACT|nr:MAG: hypothetical protein COT20_03015 [bacterium (Candidatus Gribaldobacteria) CG08_land_8_20_14_0_20_39_15]